MANVINIEKQIQNSTKALPDNNYVLGRTLMQPFKPANSGSREIMFSNHTEQLMVLTKNEVPIVQTGWETDFGKMSSSYLEAEHKYTVIYKINKFDFKNNHYYLIVRNEDDGTYDVIERLTYNHNTESYGYLWDSNALDRLHEGDTISTGDIIKTSVGFDEYGNKMNGVNLRTLYLSCEQNMEDSIVISESAATKLCSALIKTTDITINDNDVLLNMYGDDKNYKAFPDVGEKIKNGMFCSIRRLENENILYSLSQAKLREHMISDRNIIMNGTVADIDVYCNNPNVLADSYYNQQLYYYYNQYNAFCRKVVDLVGPIAMSSRMSYNLQKLYAICRDSIGGKQFFKDKQFSNVIMTITIVEDLPMQAGDKMCDRYGGKGVVSKILPDELMPVLDNGDVVEVIKNQSTCINRENLGQLHEQSITFIGMRIIDAFRFGTNQWSYSEKARIVHKYISMIDQSQADSMRQWVDNFEDEWACKLFIDSILEEDDAIIVSTPAFTTPIRLDTIAQMYEEFKDIIDLTPYTVYMPIEDSNGNIRRVPARRNLVVGKIYNYRLKQYAEEKFSVTSLSATNLKGLNTRSKANKIYETKYTKTPIMFGPMESGDLAHLGMQYVVMNLMLYSSSPQARRLFEQLLIGDPYDIDIKLDTNSKNRNAEIINALLKTMGLKLVFRKIPKKKKQLVKKVMIRDVPNKGYKYKTNIRDYVGHDGELETHYNIALRNAKNNKTMVGRVMVKAVNKDGEDNLTELGRYFKELARGQSSDPS